MSFALAAGVDTVAGGSTAGAGADLTTLISAAAGAGGTVFVAGTDVAVGAGAVTGGGDSAAGVVAPAPDGAGAGDCAGGEFSPGPLPVGVPAAGAVIGMAANSAAGAATGAGEAAGGATVGVTGDWTTAAGSANGEGGRVPVSHSASATTANAPPGSAGHHLRSWESPDSLVRVAELNSVSWIAARASRGPT